MPAVFRPMRFFAAALFLAAACSPAPLSNPTTPPAAETAPVPPTPSRTPPTPTATSLPPAETLGPPPLPAVTVTGPVQALVGAAVDDLARRLGLSPSAIRLVEVSPRTWPDASLGCPQPGRMYAQVIVEGYRIVLEARGRAYAYHTGRAEVVYCPTD